MLRATRRTWSAAALAGASLVLAGTAATAAGAPGPSRSIATPRPSALTRVAIPDTAYSIPPGARFVAPGGSDSGPGTQAQPFRTLGHALAVAPAGATVVLRTGTYRENVGNVTRPVTIQPFPHEQVWLSGSDGVTGWSRAASGWVHHNWTVQFCHSCWGPGAVAHAYPLAGYPDQVFFDSRSLTQVADLAHLVAGTFFADYAHQDLYVGSDPTVPALVVEATTRTRAMQFMATAAGSVVRGIGLLRYGPDWAESTTGEIRSLAPNMVFDHDVFTQSANRGLFVVSAAHVTVVDSFFADNGFTGLYVRNGDNFDMERNMIDNNNTEKFNDGFSSAAGAGGVKISASFHVMVKGNVATNNWGNGIWFDVSSYDVALIDNVAAYNDRNGLYVEITGTSVVAGNLSVRNGQGGLKLSGATSSRVYNNTLADNATYQLSVHDDGRNQHDPALLALGITWNTANNSFVNNILAAPAGGSSGPLVFTQNNEQPVKVDAATMIVGMDDDLYTRPTATLPSLHALWIHPAPATTSRYTSLAAFRAGTGYETHGSEVNGYSVSPVFNAPVAGDYSPKAKGPADDTGTPLPADIAALVGVAPGAPVDRGALIYS